MAKQLEEKIEETAAAAQIASANFEAIPEVEPIPEAEPAPMADPEIVPVDQPEPIQVAGIKDIIKPVGEAVIKRVEEAEKRVLPRMGAEPVEEVGGRLLIREADPSEVQAFSEAKVAEVRSREAGRLFADDNEPSGWYLVVEKLSA